MDTIRCRGYEPKGKIAEVANALFVFAAGFYVKSIRTVILFKMESYPMNRGILFLWLANVSHFFLCAEKVKTEKGV